MVLINATWAKEAVNWQFQGKGRQASGQEAQGTRTESGPDKNGLHAAEVSQEVDAQTHAGDVVPTSPDHLIVIYNEKQ